MRRLLIAAVLALAACTAPSFHNTDITGSPFGGDFSLSDVSGHPRSLADFRGKAVVLFFGYTYCPDVCPTTLLELKQALSELGSDAGRVQVLFVTLDPARDKPKLLGEYLGGFDRGFIGLYGDEQQTEKVAKDFKVFFQKVPGKTPDSYTIDHTSASYVFDPQGRLRLFVRPGRPSELAADLHTLLHAG